jgi:hypothetical protein
MVPKSNRRFSAPAAGLLLRPFQNVRHRLRVPLANLKSLETLTLGSLRLDSIDFVTGLASMTALNLNELPISSIEPVRSLQKLKSISLTSIPVVDITPLVALPSLEEVRLMRTPARSDAVSALERRGNLSREELTVRQSI